VGNPPMSDLRDRYDRFAESFSDHVRRATQSRTHATQDDYWQAVQELFTRGVTSQGLRDLVQYETRETYNFFTRELDLSDLKGRPWYERHPITAWRVFEAMAYRLNPARRILFAAAVPLLLLGWWVYLVHTVARGGVFGIFFGMVTWEGLQVTSATLLFFLLLLELRDKLGLKSDLEVARQIQFGLLPFEPFARDGISIVSAMRPANTVGGDYFDVVELGQGRVAVVIGDVAGKGMPAALLMALLQGSLRTLLTAGLRGADVIAKLNAHLFTNIPSNRLVTLFYAELDPSNGRLSYVNAGHNPPCVVRPDGAIERLPATGLALGVLAETEYGVSDVELSGGDRILLYTDGVTEAENTLGEEYGEDRVIAFLQTHGTDTDRALLDGLVANVLLYGGPVRPRDDMTLMVVGRT
jgi:phosphoserine phosphatase RsbU/P